MRLRNTNAQWTCKLQLIYLCFKNIRYYRLKITHDVIYEVILYRGFIQYLNLPFYALMNVVAIKLLCLTP